jgi:aminoglycoside/choline kinase family phosphotransferase
VQGTLQTVFAEILANNLQQPQVFVHRDYHSRNLMVVGDNARPSRPTRASWIFRTRFTAR